MKLLPASSREASSCGSMARGWLCCSTARAQPHSEGDQSSARSFLCSLCFCFAAVLLPALSLSDHQTVSRAEAGEDNLDLRLELTGEIEAA